MPEPPPEKPANPPPCPPWPGAFPLSPDYGRDVPETWLRSVAPAVLDLLLLDRTAGRRILWATDAYAARGPGFSATDEMTPDRVCADGGSLIRPRVDKRLAEQKARVASKAEVFTPAWVCNAQNNLVDQAWFGTKKPIFNRENGREWEPTSDESLSEVFRATRRSPADYVQATRLEVSCGETPYLASRYDAATGDPIPVACRIGLLDRKLRIVSIKARDRAQWLRSALAALRSVYAFEWQGDSLLLARENLLFATLEAFAARWPDTSALAVTEVEAFATVLSWNVFQMDGVKMVVPLSCHDEEPPDDAQETLDFGNGPPGGRALPEATSGGAGGSPAKTDPPGGRAKPKPRPCPGCASGDRRLHNGIRPLVVDWSLSPFERRAVPFHELFGKDRP